MRKSYQEFRSQTLIPYERWTEIQKDSKDRINACVELALVNQRKFIQEYGYRGQNKVLRKILKGTVLGTWPINRKAAVYLWNLLEEHKPKTIIEIGSGVSTRIFAAWIKLQCGSSVFVSIDQHAEELARTSNTLKSLNLLTDSIRFLHMPTSAQDKCIEFDLIKIDTALNGRKIEFVFIDGPQGETGCRANTLTALRPLFAKQATWILHDALRDGEMSFLKKWINISGITIKGIVPHGTGIAVGEWKIHT